MPTDTNTLTDRFPVWEDDRMTDPRRDPHSMHEAQHSFDVVLRGYDRNQVAETIERLEADFRIAIADRDAAVARSADLASQLSTLVPEMAEVWPGVVEG